MVLTCVAAVTFTARPAQAKCVGPSISSSATDVNRGETITVTGKAWGTGCNDVNPDASEGALFAPKTGIVVEIIQGGQHTVLAKGNAAKDYAFTVQVEVPSTLQPGPATLTAGTPAAPVGLTISDSPPSGEAQTSVASFGPTGPVKPKPMEGSPTAQSSGGGTSPVWWIVGAIIVVIIGVLVFSRKTISEKLQR